MIKAIFKRMFSETQTKIYALFLETLNVFIEDYKEHLEDWVFLMLLRLLHRHGGNLQGPVLFKLQFMLELIRKSFDTDQQFSTLCRILNDQSQPMNRKVRLAWLEYMTDLIPLMDSGDLRESTETRQAIAKLLQATSEPKSGDIRRLSQSVITALFDLNPATFSLMQRSVSKALQETANKILKVYMQETASSSDEESSSPSHKRPASQASRHRTHVPLSSTTKLTSPRPASSAAFYRSTTPSRNRIPSEGTPGDRGRSQTPSRVTPGSGIPVPRSSSRTGMRTGGATRRLSGSSSDVSDNSVTPRNGLSKSDTPRSKRSITTSASSGNLSGIPRRPGSTTPGQTPPTLRREGNLPPRAASVDPDVMAARTAAAQLQRPGSARSNYEPENYNGIEEPEPKHENPQNETNVEKFSFSDLPKLDYGSGDEKEENDPPVVSSSSASPSVVGVASSDEPSRDQMALALRELGTASSTKEKQTALTAIYNQARSYPEKCHWPEHFKTTMVLLLQTMSKTEEVGVRTVSLRILRELLKTEHSKMMAEYAEMVTLRVLVNFSDSDTTLSQAAEDTFSLLAPALPSASTIDLLSPMVAKEKYPMLLGCIRLLTKVATLSQADYLRSKLPDLVPGLMRGYAHQESTVRKASVFCLVSVHSVVGAELKDHLTKLSSSQTKLLDLYIKRHQQQSQNGPR